MNSLDFAFATWWPLIFYPVTDTPNYRKGYRAPFDSREYMKIWPFFDVPRYQVCHCSIFEYIVLHLAQLEYK
jgi:hypothetical protein